MVKLDHVRLGVTDWQKSRDWYIGHFGFKLEFEVPESGPDKRGVAAIQDDSGLTVFLEEIGRSPLGSTCIFYLQVDDVDEAHRRLLSHGVSFSASPQRFFWGYGAELTDPDGYVIRIWDERSMKEQ